MELKMLFEKNLLSHREVVVAALLAQGFIDDEVENILEQCGASGRRSWTADEVERMGEMYTTGVRMKEICAAFNATRSQVTGQVARYRWLRPQVSNAE